MFLRINMNQGEEPEKYQDVNEALTEQYEQQLQIMREQDEQSALQEEEIREQEAVIMHYDDLHLTNTKLIEKLRELG